MMDKEPTICAKCREMIFGTEKYPDMVLCKASPKLDYVTGALEAVSCSTKNDGACPDYAPSDEPLDPQADAAMGSYKTDDEDARKYPAKGEGVRDD